MVISCLLARDKTTLLFSFFKIVFQLLKMFCKTDMFDNTHRTGVSVGKKKKTKKAD